MRSLRPFAIAVTATLLTVLPGGTASAQLETFVRITEATGDEGGVRLRGKVSSPEASCRSRRNVVMYDDVSPSGLGPEDFPFGAVITNENGAWRGSTEFAPSRVIVKVKPKKRRGPNCAGAVSRTKRVTFQ